MVQLDVRQLGNTHSRNGLPTQQRTGTIEILDTSATNADDDIPVSYDYQATSGATTVALLVPLVVALQIMVSLVAKVMEMM